MLDHLINYLMCKYCLMICLFCSLGDLGHVHHRPPQYIGMTRTLQLGQPMQNALGSRDFLSHETLKINQNQRGLALGPPSKTGPLRLSTVSSSSRWVCPESEKLGETADVG